MLICLVAGLLMAPLGDAVTLRWTHSIEKILWEEDYRLAGDHLHLVEARVRGTGAGMEPPADAVFKDGVWRYTPAVATFPRIQLLHSPHAAPYTVCNQTTCKTVVAWLPGLPEHTVIEMTPCLDR